MTWNEIRSAIEKIPEEWLNEVAVFITSDGSIYPVNLQIAENKIHVDDACLPSVSAGEPYFCGENIHISSCNK